jgi:hypothetical protein
MRFSVADQGDQKVREGHRIVHCESGCLGAQESSLQRFLRAVVANQNLVCEDREFNREQ